MRIALLRLPRLRVFRLDLSLQYAGLISGHASLNTCVVLCILVAFAMVFITFFAVLAIGLLRRSYHVLYPRLDLGGLSIHWFLHGTPFKHVQ